MARNPGSLRAPKTQLTLDRIEATKIKNTLFRRATEEDDVAAARLLLEYTVTKPAQTVEVDHFERVEWDVTHILPAEAVAAASALTGPALQRLGSSQAQWEDGAVCEPADPEGSTGSEH